MLFTTACRTRGEGRSQTVWLMKIWKSFSESPSRKFKPAGQASNAAVINAAISSGNVLNEDGFTDTNNLVSTGPIADSNLRSGSGNLVLRMRHRQTIITEKRQLQKPFI